MATTRFDMRLNAETKAKAEKALNKIERQENEVDKKLTKLHTEWGVVEPKKGPKFLLKLTMAWLKIELEMWCPKPLQYIDSLLESALDEIKDKKTLKPLYHSRLWASGT